MQLSQSKTDEVICAGERVGLARHWKNVAGSVLVVLWFAGTLVPMSLLMVGHLLTLPEPQIDARLRQKIELSAAARSSSWFVIHVLAEDCECSQSVLRHLLERGAEAGFSEKVLVVGSGDAVRSQILARGFAFESITAEELQASYGLQSVPVMVVANPKRVVAYLGGYSSTRLGPPEDLMVLRALTQGQEFKALPLFGCAVAQELQRRLDPLGLKYTVAQRGAQ